MQVLIFRHGIAEDREEFAATGATDSERPLTPRGEKRTRGAARGLRRIIDRIDVVACSPLVRARETAEILVRAFAKRNASQLQQVQALAPGGDRDDLVAWLNTFPSSSTVALVGHEPDLSLLLGYLTSGGEGTYARFGKAGAALVDFAGAIAPGSGELVWLLPPALLRRFGI